MRHSPSLCSRNSSHQQTSKTRSQHMLHNLQKSAKYAYHIFSYIQWHFQGRICGNTQRFTHLSSQSSVVWGISWIRLILVHKISTQINALIHNDYRKSARYNKKQQKSTKIQAHLFSWSCFIWYLTMQKHSKDIQLLNNHNTHISF